MSEPTDTEMLDWLESTAAIALDPMDVLDKLIQFGWTGDLRAALRAAIAREKP